MIAGNFLEVMKAKDFIKKYWNEENELIYSLVKMSIHKVVVEEDRFIGILGNGRRLEIELRCPNCQRKITPEIYLFYLHRGYENDPIVCEECIKKALKGVNS